MNGSFNYCALSYYHCVTFTIAVKAFYLPPQKVFFLMAMFLRHLSVANEI